MILHVDMDAFYASIEQRDHPEYRGLPVIVGGLGSRGVVSTASYEARKYGVGSAMAMEKARRLCPKGIFLAGDHAHYRAVSTQLMAILGEFSPTVEPLALDEAFLDISGMGTLYPDPMEMGRAIKQRIYDELELVASVGIGPNKYLAKLASDWQKPNGLFRIREEEAEAFLRPLSVRALWGVGKFTAARLAAAGIVTVGDVADTPLARLVPLLGKQARVMKDLAHGIDRRVVESDREAQSIGNEETFEQDLFTDEEVERELLYLSEKVGYRLRKAGYFAQTITVKVRFASFRTVTRSKTLADATQFDEVLYRTACELYRKAKGAEGIRLLGVTGSQLTRQEQTSLFAEGSEKKKALYSAVDALKAKFGVSIITKAGLLKREEKEE